MDTEILDSIFQILAIIAPFAGGAAAVFIKKAVFFSKVARQAVDVFEQLEKDNALIYTGVISDPEKQELAKVLRGAVKKIKGLTEIYGSSR